MFSAFKLSIVVDVLAFLPWRLFGQLFEILGNFFQIFCGLYYKPITIVNDDSRVINKLEASLTDDARVVI
jgi:hypothetical protein